MDRAHSWSQELDAFEHDEFKNNIFGSPDPIFDKTNVFSSGSAGYDWIGSTSDLSPNYPELSRKH